MTYPPYPDLPRLPPADPAGPSAYPAVSHVWPSHKDTSAVRLKLSQEHKPDLSLMEHNMDQCFLHMPT